MSRYAETVTDAAPVRRAESTGRWGASRPSDPEPTWIDRAATFGDHGGAVGSGAGGGQPPWITSTSCSDSSSVNSRDLIRNRCPVGDSTLKPLPRPGTTSTVRWVWLQ